MKKRILLALLLISVLIFCGCDPSSRFNPEDYKIVYAANDGEGVANAALELAKTLGIPESAVVSDAVSPFDSTAKEIIVGNTNRPLSVKYSHSSDILTLDYIIKYEENNWVVFGGSPEATFSAVKYCIDSYKSGNTSTLLDYSYHHDYEIDSIIIDNIPVTCFNAVSPDGEYTELLKHVSDTLTKKSGLRHTDHTHVFNIFIRTDLSISADEFIIKVRNSDITISGANSYAIDSAISYFLNEVLVPETKLTSNQDFKGKINPKIPIYSNFISYRSDLINTYNKLTQDKKLNIVYFGGSISSGYGASDSSLSWTNLTADWFKSTFPESQINTYTSSISSSGSMLGAFRCAHDVLALKPDLVLLEFAVNDAYSGFENEQILTYFESMIRQIKEYDPNCDIIALYAADQNTVRQNLNTMSPQAELQEDIAAVYGIPSVNIGAGLCSTFDFSDDNEWKKYFADIVHPNDNGHQTYFTILREYFENSLIYSSPTASTSFVMPEKLSKAEFNPRFIPANEIDIIENRNWELVSDSYWSVANPYSGYLTPVDSGNYLKIRFDGGEHAALFAQYSSDNRLIYTIDRNTERISSQSVNQPLLLYPSFVSEQDAETPTQHSLSMSIQFNDMTKPFILTGLLIW